MSADDLDSSSLPPMNRSSSIEDEVASAGKSKRDLVYSNGIISRFGATLISGVP